MTGLFEGFRRMPVRLCWKQKVFAGHVTIGLTVVCCSALWDSECCSCFSMIRYVSPPCAVLIMASLILFALFLQFVFETKREGSLVCVFMGSAPKRLCCLFVEV